MEDIELLYPLEPLPEIFKPIYKYSNSKMRI
jgi:hypothetical protein